MPIILVAKGKHDTGKTTAICQLKNFLLSLGGKTINTYKAISQHDVNMIVEYNGIKIGISSAGDPGLKQREILTVFVEMNCNIIICACRTKGSTKNEILEYFNMEKINYFTPSDNGFISFEHMKNRLISALKQQ
jgi:hypothetical protein